MNNPNPLTDRQIQYGSNDTLPERRTLRAGDLTCIYESGFLRYIRVGDHEVLRYIYVALRDTNWNTITPILSEVEIEQGADHFRITYTCDHKQDEIDFRWRAEITGSAKSWISFSMQGKALTSFKRNRFGFCLLHPAQAAGEHIIVTHTDFRSERAQFPGHIEPYTVFADVRQLTHLIGTNTDGDDRSLEIRFEGAPFETEDQRNWSDASFKTYNIESAQPFPVQVQQGDIVEQSITVTLTQPEGGSIPSTPLNTTVQVTIDPSRTVGKLPGIGLSAVIPEPIYVRVSQTTTDRLDALKLHHFRENPDLSSGVSPMLNRPIRLAAFCVSEQDLVALAKDIQSMADYRQIFDALLVFDLKTYVSTPGLLANANKIFYEVSPDTRIGGGTDALFVDLNRKRPAIPDGDLVAFSITPQVHAFDNATIVEALPIYRQQLENARVLYPNHAFAVGPITLKMRSSPTVSDDSSPKPDTLPSHVDPRQMSLFGAGWLAVSLRYLSEGGADSVTFGDTHSYNGVMQTESGSPQPDLYPSMPNSVYPMYHVLRTLADWRGADASHFETTDPLSVDGIALQYGFMHLVILVNFTEDNQRVSLSGYTQSIRRYRLLDTATARQYADDPEGFASSSQPVPSDTSAITLPPFALAFIEYDA